MEDNGRAVDSNATVVDSESVVSAPVDFSATYDPRIGPRLQEGNIFRVTKLVLVGLFGGWGITLAMLGGVIAIGRDSGPVMEVVAILKDLTILSFGAVFTFWLARVTTARP